MGQQIGEAPACIIIDTEAGEAVWFSLQGPERDRPERAGGGTGGLTEMPGWLTGAGRSAP